MVIILREGRGRGEDTNGFWEYKIGFVITRSLRFALVRTNEFCDVLGDGPSESGGYHGMHPLFRIVKNVYVAPCWVW